MCMISCCRISGTRSFLKSDNKLRGCLKTIFQNRLRQPIFLAHAKKKATNYTPKTVHKTRGAGFASQKVYCFSFLYAMPPPEQTGGFPTGLFVLYGAVSVC